MSGGDNTHILKAYNNVTLFLREMYYNFVYVYT